MRRVATQLKPSLTLPVQLYPLLVHFKDIHDPKSIEALEPLEPDTFVAAFGPGVKLRRITLTVTDDPITTGIEKRLRWLLSQRGSLVPQPSNVNIGDMPPAQMTNEGDFSQGISK